MGKENLKKRIAEVSPDSKRDYTVASIASLTIERRLSVESFSKCSLEVVISDPVLPGIQEFIEFIPRP